MQTIEERELQNMLKRQCYCLVSEYLRRKKLLEMNAEEKESNTAAGVSMLCALLKRASDEERWERYFLYDEENRVATLLTYKLLPRQPLMDLEEKVNLCLESTIDE